jgi:hypothetical protein
VFDEPGQRIQAEAVLAAGELPLFAEVAVAQDVERLRVVGSVDDAQVLPAADLQARLDPAVCPVGWLDDDALASGCGQFQPPAGGLGTRLLRGEVGEAVPGRGDEVALKLRELGEVPFVRLGERECVPLGGEDLERRERDPVESAGGTAVGGVRVPEGGGVSESLPRASSEASDVQATCRALIQGLQRLGERVSCRSADGGVLRLDQLDGLG